MLERPTELLVGTQSLPIDRPRSRLPTQNPVSTYILYNIAPRSCPYMCFGSETVRVTATIPPRFFSLFEFCRHIAAFNLARPPPFYTRMRRAVPSFRRTRSSSYSRAVRLRENLDLHSRQSALLYPQCTMWWTENFHLA